MNKKPTIILFSGKSGSGKDYIANIFKQELEKQNKKVLITHYADLLKYILKTFFNWDGKKDEEGRNLLQYVGTNVIRKQMPNYWVDFINDILIMFKDQWDYILIPDTRFYNEIKLLKDNINYNVYTIRITRYNYINSLTDEQKNHQSEIDLDNYDFDDYIVNFDSNNTNNINVLNSINKINNKFKENTKTLSEKTRTIFIDMDGVLFNAIKCIVEMYDQDFSNHPNYKKVSWKDIVSWDFSELELAHTEHTDFITDYFNQKRFFHMVEMFPDAKKAINRLNEKYKIVFVSMGNKYNLINKEEYLKKYFPYASFIGVDHSIYSDKSHIDMSGEGNVFIDDLANNLDTSNADIKICFGETYEWNKNFDDSKTNCFNAFNWLEVNYILLEDYTND